MKFCDTIHIVSKAEWRKVRKDGPPLSSGVTTPTAVGEPGLLDKIGLGALTEEALLSRIDGREVMEGIEIRYKGGMALCSSRFKFVVRRFKLFS